VLKVHVTGNIRRRFDVEPIEHVTFSLPAGHRTEIGRIRELHFLARKWVLNRQVTEILMDLRLRNGSAKVAKPAGAGRVLRRESGAIGRSVGFPRPRSPLWRSWRAGETPKEKSKRGLDADGSIP
jgi:hypothetical protein